MAFADMTGLGWMIITLGIIIGLGIIIFAQMGSILSSCQTGYSYNTNGSAIFSTNSCCNVTSTNCIGSVNSSSASLGTQNVNSISTYLGTTNGGLASWIPLIIVMVIGLFFLGAFMGRKGSQA